MAEDKPPQKNAELTRWMIVIVSVLAALALMYNHKAPTPLEASEPVAYSEFLDMVQQDLVLSVSLQGNKVSGKLIQPRLLGDSQQETDRFTANLPDPADPDMIYILRQHKVEIGALPVPEEKASVLAAIFPWLFLLALYFFFLRPATRNMGGGLGGSGDMKRFLAPSKKEVEVPEVRFADVAGQENAKREVSELVDFLSNPDEFTKLGAEVPRGVLLMGAPGTGKTLLARALAGEAGVPFFNISASEFIEMFVGVGASRVRNLFGEAKKKAPSIIFIDELDSVGRTRGTGLGGGHDEREQTLNQILAEMDGFKGREAVIVLAATNRPDVLDPALMRPGRFDRHVTLELPERKDREAILRVHVRKVPIADDVKLHEVAAGTPGFSGADLKNLINEAALLAAHEKSDKVFMRHLEASRDKVMMGPERSLAIQPEERHRLAVHESGHTLLAWFLPHADPIYKVSIVPRGRALGVTQQVPDVERHTLPEDYLRDRLAVMLGGRNAEKQLLGTFSSGADDDIKRATELARAMVSRWGMSEDIGPVDLRDAESHPFLGREIAQPRHFSEESAELVDHAVQELLKQAEEKAIGLINAHRIQLNRLISQLEADETLDKTAIEQCLGSAVREVANG